MGAGSRTSVQWLKPRGKEMHDEADPRRGDRPSQPTLAPHGNCGCGSGQGGDGSCAGPCSGGIVTEPWLVLITRIGVGVSRDGYYRHRVRVAELALGRSLRAQTDKSFTWVLVRDVRAPAWVDGEFEGLATGLSFDIWRRDPTVEGINPVDRPAVRAMTASRPTILSRCDEDDLLASRLHGPNPSRARRAGLLPAR